MLVVVIDEDLSAAQAAELDVVWVLARLGSTPSGLGAAEAAGRLGRVGPNAVRSHRAGAITFFVFGVMVVIGLRWFLSP
jgi:hypothetical protein